MNHHHDLNAVGVRVFELSRMRKTYLAVVYSLLIAALLFSYLISLLTKPINVAAQASSSSDDLTFVDHYRNIGLTDKMGSPSSMLLSPGPNSKFVYVTSSVGQSVSVFLRNPSNSELTLIDTTDGFSGLVIPLALNAVAMSSDGRHMYTAATSFGVLQKINRNTTTGLLTPGTFFRDEFDGVDTIAGVAGVVISPDGKFVYAAGREAVSVFSRDLTTGELTYLPDATQIAANEGDLASIVGASGLALSPDGNSLYVAGTNADTLAVFSRNSITGHLTFVESHTDNVSGIDGLDLVERVVVSSDGKNVYTTSQFENTISVFNRATDGRLAFNSLIKNGQGGIDGLEGAWGIAISPDGAKVYVTGTRDDTLLIFDRNQSNGALTYVESLVDNTATISGLKGVAPVAVSSDNQSVYVSGRTEDNGIVAFRRGGLHSTSQTPIANAGPDQVAVLDLNNDGVENVTLDATRSSDPDGDGLLYFWKQGHYNIATGASPTLSFAKVGSPHVLTLTVVDPDGNFDTDTVLINVKEGSGTNQDPTLNPIANQDVIAGEQLRFNISATDPEGAIIRFSTHNAPDGSFLSNLGNNVVEFIWSTTLQDVGVYGVTVYASDGEGGFDTESFTINVTNGITNGAPVASAGIDQTITDTNRDGSEVVILDGRSSSDPDGDSLTYTWTEGSTTLGTGSTLNHAFTVGVHTVTLTIDDGNGAIDTDTVLITVNAAPNRIPTANAGADQTVTDTDRNGSEVITLDGRSSSDPDGDSLTYTWSTGGSDIGTGSTLNHTFAVGTHTVTLTVDDGNGGRDTDTVVIIVQEGLVPLGELTFIDFYQNIRSGGANELGVPSFITMSSDGNFVYVGAAVSGSISVFSRNTVTDELSLIQTAGVAFGGAGLSSFSLSPDGRSGYATAATVDVLHQFSRDTATGLITGLTEPENFFRDGFSGIDGLGRVSGSVVSPDGNFVYVSASSDAAVTVFSRNKSTGVLTALPDLTQSNNVGGVDGLLGAASLILSSDGTSLYVAGTSEDKVAVFSRDVTTGALTFRQVLENGVNSVDGLDGVQRLAMSSDGAHVYAVGSAEHAVAVFSRAGDGILTFRSVVKDNQGGVVDLGGAFAAAVSPDGQQVYVTATGDNALLTFDRNQTNGALTFVNSQIDNTAGVDGLGNPTAVAVSLDGRGVYAAGSLSEDSAIVAFKRESTDPTNRVPTANAGADQTVNDSDRSGGESITLDGRSSFDPDSYSLTYTWSAGGSDIGTGSTLNHTFSVAGSPHTVTLTVDDGNGGIDTDTMMVTVNAPGTLGEGRLEYVDFYTNVDGVNWMSGPIALAVVSGPVVDYVYVGSEPGKSISIFERTKGASELTLIDTYDFISDGFWNPKELRSMVVSPDGTSIYTAAMGSNIVQHHIRDINTGLITPGKAFIKGIDGIPGVENLETLKGAAIAVVSPDGRHVYVSAGLGAGIAVFSRNLDTGELTPLPALTVENNVNGVTGLVANFGLELSPDGTNVYLTDSSAHKLLVFSRDIETGALTFIESHQDDVSGVDGLEGAQFLSISPDGKHVYVAGNLDSAIAVFSRTDNGTLTFKSVVKDGQGGVNDLARVNHVMVGPDGRHVYASGRSDHAIVVFNRDATTGALTFVESQIDDVNGVDGIDGVMALAMSPDQKSFYATGISLENSSVAAFDRGSVNTNRIPVAYASIDQTVTDSDRTGSEQVTLNGVGSYDPDGDTLTYTWSVGGSNIGTGAILKHNFNVGVHTVTLTINDGRGRSDTDTVVITINGASNRIPTANAGPDQTVNDVDFNNSELVTLSGSGSDPDGDTLTYTWSEGGATIATGRTANVVLSFGIHRITLTVSDGKGGIATDEVKITIISDGNRAPVANAGADINVTDTNRDGLEVVTLDGRGSSDPDGDSITYTWTKGVTTLGTGVELTNQNFSLGSHVITLTVSDGNLSNMDTVMVNVSAAANRVPDAQAGADQTVKDSDYSGAEMVTLNATGTTDPDGDTLTYFWNEGNTQLGQGINFSHAFSVGSHTVTLIATDSKGGVDTDSVVILVQSGDNRAPVANAGADRIIVDEDRSGSETVTLNGGASVDPDGDTLTYTWSTDGSDIGTGVSLNHQFATGVHIVTLTVNDGVLTDTNETAITVQPAPNRKPVIDTVRDQTTPERAPYRFTLQATDADGDVLTWAADSVPAGATLNDNGDGSATITWTPSAAQGGEQFTIAATVRDTEGANSSVSFSVSVRDIDANLEPNDFPIFEPTLQDVFTKEGQISDFTITVVDPFGTPDVTAEGLQSWMTFDGSKMTLHPGRKDAGDYQVTFTALDPVSNRSTSSSMTVNVERVNVVPSFNDRLTEMSFVVGRTKTLTFSASDGDDEELFFTASNTPKESTFTDKAKVGELVSFIWQPTLADVGVFNVDFSVTDGRATDTMSVRFTVTEHKVTSSGGGGGGGGSSSGGGGGGSSSGGGGGGAPISNSNTTTNSDETTAGDTNNDTNSSDNTNEEANSTDTSAASTVTSTQISGGSVGSNSGTGVSTNNSVTNRPAVTFSRPVVLSKPLTRGTADPDVKLIQEVLNADPDTRVAATGPGSPGSETLAFGSLTEEAIKKFQVKYGVVSSDAPGTPGLGRVGPKTRAKLMEIATQLSSTNPGSGVSVNTTQTNTSTGVGSTPIVNTGSANGGGNTSTGGSVSLGTVRFTQPLALGTRNTNVRILQQVLNADPDTRVSVAGAGAPGQESSYFGGRTRAAVIKFQLKYGVVSSDAPGTPGLGRVGPKTRAKLNEVAAGLSGTPAVTSDVPGTTTQTPTTTVPPSATGGTSVSTSGSFARPLFVGTRSSDVKRLQELLNQDPDTRVSETAGGSPGRETTYYGQKTADAVARFQVKYGVVSSDAPGTPGLGRVGPKTRAALNELLNSSQ